MVSASLLAAALVAGAWAQTGGHGAATTPAAHAGDRVLHFPADRSLGSVQVLDERIERRIDGLNYWEDGALQEWQYVGQARGEVEIPAGKRVRLDLNRRSGNDLATLAKLGPDELYELRIGERADDRCLHHVVHLSGLKVLEFPRSFARELPVFTANGLRLLGGLGGVERLIAPTGLTDAGLASLVEALPRLKTLFLFGHRLTDSGLEPLTRLASLEELVIGDGRLKDASLEPLARVPSLRYLSFQGDGFTDGALEHVRAIATLETLDLPTAIGNAGIAHLAGHRRLEALAVAGATDEGLRHLKAIPSLKRLDLDSLRGTSITNAGLVHLRELKLLEHLRLPSVDMTEEGLAHLAELSQLKYLWVERHSESPVNDAGIRQLARLKLLESLLISGKHLTATGMASIAELRNLRALALGVAEVSNEGMASLGQLEGLERLHLLTHQVTVSGLNELDHLPRLREVEVSGLVSDEATVNLGRLSRLKTLSLTCASGSRLSDVDLACLAGMKELEMLHLWGATGVTDEGLRHLAGLSSLRMLHGLGSTEITDHGLAALASLQRLGSLSISGSLTDAGLQQLAKMPGLYDLRVSGEFTDEGLAHLNGLENLMVLKIYSTKTISTAAKSRLRRSLPELYELGVEERVAVHGVPNR